MKFEMYDDVCKAIENANLKDLKEIKDLVAARLEVLVHKEEVFKCAWCPEYFDTVEDRSAHYSGVRYH